MPRETSRPKQYNCPYCSKSYAAINSVYTHTKSVHGKKYSQNEVSIVNDPIAEKEGRLAELKRKFVDGDVTLEEYQEQIENINQRFSVTRKHVYACLDIGKVMARDCAHIATFIDVMSDYEFESIAALIKSNNHIEAFTRLLKKPGTIYRILQQIVESDVRCKDTNLTGAQGYLTDYYAHGLRGEVLLYLPAHNKGTETYEVISREKMIDMVISHVDYVNIWKDSLDCRGEISPQRCLVSLQRLFMQSCDTVYYSTHLADGPRFSTDYLTGTKYLNIPDLRVR